MMGSFIKRNLIRLLVTGVLFVTVLGAATKEGNHDDEQQWRDCNYPAIFNFGDSNSDTGSISAAYFPKLSPSGMTFFNGPAGRSSDGRLIVDFIAQRFKLPYLSGYLDSFGTNFRHGANFATGGATILRYKESRFVSGISPFPFDIQAVQFSNFKNRTTMLYSNKNKKRFSTNPNKEEFPTPDDFSKSLFVIDIGQNDLTVAFNKATISQETIRAQLIPEMINQLVTSIQFLHQQGARTFWIHNTGPIGCLPSTLFGLGNMGPGYFDENGCVRFQNDMAREFNAKLKERVSELRTELPFASLIYVDMFAAKYSLISDAKKQGFYENLNICCGSFKNGVRSHCGNVVLKNGTMIFVDTCKYPSKHISWDGIHYTEAANKWISDKIMNGYFSDQMVPIHKACLFNN